jgi:hypothetical protein
MIQPIYIIKRFCISSLLNSSRTRLIFKTYQERREINLLSNDRSGYELHKTDR